jgi:microcystin degradation protein MlrC
MRPMPHVVLTAEFAHETNTFSRIQTGYDKFLARSFCLEGDAAIAARGHANTELAGFLDIAREYDWDVIHVISASANPGGPVTRDAFERLAGAIVAAAQANRDRLDGIALGLHGAMVTTFCEDGEGELLARLRAVVGPDLPIAITLDLHANVTRAMCELANIIVSYQTYPHVDMRRTGLQAAAILERAMAGEIRPVTIRARRPMLSEASNGRTDVGPMIGWLARSRVYESEADVFAVSINAGFSHADIAEVGPSVLVTCQGDLQRHMHFAEAIADEVWDTRFHVVNHYYSVEEAAALCLAHSQEKSSAVGPIVVADYSDNPGGGAYGDSTHLLAALLKAGVAEACFGPMVDAATVRQLQACKVGDLVEIELGGKTDPTLGGGPLHLSGKLMLLSDGVYIGDGPLIGGQKRSWGPTAVLRVDRIDILVVTNAAQMWDLQQFRAFGIDPATKAVVALKSAQHFRAAFGPIAARVILCDSGALCGPNHQSLPWKNVTRPIFPLDQDIDIAAWKAAHP